MQVCGMKHQENGLLAYAVLVYRDKKSSFPCHYNTFFAALVLIATRWMRIKCMRLSAA